MIHFVRVATGEVGELDRLDGNSLRDGVALAEWYGAENLRIHAVINAGGDIEEQRELLQWIKQQGGDVTARQLRQNVRAYRAGDDAERALQALVSAGFGEWVTSEPTPEGGRPTSIFRLSPLTTDNETLATFENFEVSLSRAERNPRLSTREL